MKAVFLVTFLLACVTTAEASLPFSFVSYKQDVVGQIVKLKTTWVHVKDERSVDTYRFFAHTNRLKGLQVGDRVRVYFYLNKSNLISIKKMTGLKYNQEKQNLGYITRKIKE